MERKQIEILGESISYIEENNGKPKVLFLHGFNSNYNFASEVYKMDNRKYDIIAFDFPGCGQSSSNNIINIEFYQKIASEFVKIKKIQDFLVVGHSLGGASALYLLDNQMAKYALLAAPINYNIFSSNLKKAKNNLKKWLLPQTIDEAKDSTMNLVYEPEKKYKQNIDMISRAFLRIINIKRNIFYNLVIKQMINPSYLNNEIKKLYKKDLKYEFITGDKDFFVPLSSISEIANEINKEITILNKCGHALFFEKPQEVNEKINEIISKIY